MQKQTLVLKVLLVACSIFLTSHAFAAQICFSSLAEYEAVKSSLPRVFQSLPVILTTGGVANGGIKVEKVSGKIRIRSAIWTPTGLGYGDENLDKACFDGKKANFAMADGSQFGVSNISSSSMTVSKPGGGSAKFNLTSNSEYMNKIAYINGGAADKGVSIPPGFGTR